VVGGGRNLGAMASDAAPVRRSTTPHRILAVAAGGRAAERPDRLVTEEPLEIRLAGPDQAPAPVVVTMRTPGHDFELAAGFLVTEGLVGATDVVTVRYCDDVDDAEQRYNIATVRTSRPVDPSTLPSRRPATSACGLCGTTSLDELGVRCGPVAAGPVVAWSTLQALPDRLREAQRLFDQTGGLHGAGLVGPAGDLVAVREDVGRHNAVDKVVGRAVLARRLPLDGHLLVVSGRVGFEIVQKAAVAGVALVAAVSAPSSLAVAAAERFGMTLVGFLRDGRGNVYCGPGRVDLTR
jgi:FdhD protein